jgi:hypothetical protein
MPVKSSPFEHTLAAGDDAKAFLRRLRYGRGTKAAVASAINGRRLVAVFMATGAVPVVLNVSSGTQELRTGDNT